MPPSGKYPDVIALAKKEPGKLNFSSPGLASTTFIAGAQFRRIAGINIVHVPFRSAPDAVTAVIRGDAQFYFAPSNLARDQSEAGKVRAIAAATAQRIPEGRVVTCWPCRRSWPIRLTSRLIARTR